MAVSVCLAAYNGSPFIAEQLHSIMLQLDGDDELIVIDDGSTDNTMDIVGGFADPRVRIVRNERNLGVNATFARAMALATKEFVFLSDQDDIWPPGRKALMLDAFRDPRIDVVAGNHSLIDRNGAPVPGSMAPSLNGHESRAPLRNLLRIFRGRQNYYGCAMAFRRTARTRILPYPAGMECHDIWIGMIGIVSDSIVHVEPPVLLHRVHGNNASIIKRSLPRRIAARVVLSYHLAVAIWRSVRAGLAASPSVRNDRAK